MECCQSQANLRGLNSGIYAGFKAAFVATGLYCVGLPIQTLDLVFGTFAKKGLEDMFLWHLTGTAVSMGIAAITFMQNVLVTSSCALINAAAAAYQRFCCKVFLVSLVYCTARACSCVVTEHRAAV